MFLIKKILMIQNFKILMKNYCILTKIHYLTKKQFKISELFFILSNYKIF